MNFKKMCLYKISRSIEEDHKLGRPGIFLDYFGEESLVWLGTSKKTNLKEEPVILIIDGKSTYFYNKGIQKINSKSIVNKWINFENKKIIELPVKTQMELVNKFCKLTKQTNPYELIKKLETEIKTITEQLVRYQQELITSKLEKDLLLASANKIINELQNKLEQLQQELLSIHK